MNPETARLRRATNVTLDSTTLEEARALGVNVSRACDRGLADAVQQARGEIWQKENREGIEAWNAWADEHGLPLENDRLF